MSKHYPYIVIGAGAAGLVVAIGLAKMKRSVLLIENGRFGGDCTNFGCVPSKALIQSSHIAESITQAERYSIKASTSFDASGAFSYVKSVVESIKQEESAEALEKRGVQVLEGYASFIDKHTLHVQTPSGEESVSANKIIIATGSKPRIPQIKGLETIDYLTNETIFSLDKIPESLAVVGNGPIGIEMASCFARLGSKVSIIGSAEHILAREDLDTSIEIEEMLKEKGATIISNAKTSKAYNKNGQIFLEYLQGSETKTLTCSHVLIATGREPHCDGLKLENANVVQKDGYILVDRHGRSSQKHIYAAGDCTGPPFFTHRSENHGRVILKNLLIPFHLFSFDTLIPRVTYTIPEVASIGLSENEAKKIFPNSTVIKLDLTQVDRARTMGETKGFIKVITKKRSSKILGACIVAPRAGEMLMELAVCMKMRIPFSKLSNLIHPYPILNQGIRKASDLWLTTFLKNLFNRSS